MDTQSTIALWSAITFFGNWKFIVALTLITMSVLWKKGRAREAFVFGASLFAAEVATLSLKFLAHHPRPLDALVPVEDPYSFPSGHSMIAVAFYGMFATLLFRAWPHMPWRRVAVFAVLASIILLVGVSRVVLGVHYPQDVLAGYAVGAFFWIIFYAISPRFSVSEKKKFN